MQRLLQFAHRFMFITIIIVGGGLATSTRATTIDVASNTAWPENLADLGVITTSPNLGAANPRANDGQISDSTDTVHLVFDNTATATVTLTFGSPQSLSLVGAWFDHSPFGGGEPARDVSQVEFFVNGSSVGIVLPANYEPQTGASVAQVNNTLGRFAFASVSGAFLNASTVGYVFTSANGATGDPRIAEVVALAALPVPEPSVAWLIGVGALVLWRNSKRNG